MACDHNNYTKRSVALGRLKITVLKNQNLKLKPKDGRFLLSRAMHEARMEKHYLPQSLVLSLAFLPLYF